MSSRSLAQMLHVRLTGRQPTRPVGDPPDRPTTVDHPMVTTTTPARPSRGTNVSAPGCSRVFASREATSGPHAHPDATEKTHSWWRSCA